MVVRTSNPLFLEVLTSSPSLGVPIEFDVYDGTAPATMLATLENAYDRSFTQVLPDLGAGTFRISRHDPKNTPTIIRRGNIVKCKVAGIYRFAWLIDDISDVPLSPGEGGGEVLQVSGRGVGALLDRAIVYPPVFPPATIGMIGTASATNAVTSSIAVTRPTGAKVGDLLLYGIAVTGGSSANITPPAGRGWVQIRRDEAGTSLALFVFRRRITATTNQTSDTFTIDTARQANAVAYCWRGVSVNDLDMSDAGQNNGSSVNITAPAVTPGLVNSVAVAFFATAVNTSVTPPAGYAEQRDINTTGVTIEGSTRAFGSSLATTGPVVGVALNAAVNVGVQILMAPSAESAASYIGLTWGAILSDQLTEAQARGALPGITWDFSTTVDSMGAPWADTPQIVFPAGTPQLDVYRQAIAMGLDAQVTTDLVVQVYEEYARHKETTVILRGGYHLTDTVEKRLTEHGLKSRLLVEGAGGLFFEVSDAALEADPLVGRREGFLSFTTAVDPTTMQRGGEETLASLAAEAEALSIPVRHGTGSGQYEPYVDYRIGDWITLDVPGTYDMTAFRIAAITLQDQDGPDFAVTLDLNSVSLEYLALLKRQLDQIGNPSSGSGTVSGSLSSSGSGGATASTGQVAATIGDAPGYLFDKIAVGGGIAKSLVGTAPSQQLRLQGTGGTLDGLSDVDTSTVPPTNGQALVYDLASLLWKPGAGGAGGGGGILALVNYDPATAGTSAVSGTTIADLDATNQAITFTMASTGTVLVGVSVLVGSSLSGGDPSGIIGLREGSTTVAETMILNGTNGIGRRTVWFSVAGVTAGVHTYKLAGRLATTGGNYTVYFGASTGVRGGVVLWVQSVGGSGGGSAPAYVEAPCTADTTVSAANAFTAITGCSMVLGAGNWLVQGQVDVRSPSGTYIFVAIVDGSNTVLRDATRPTITSGGLSGTGEATIAIAGVKVAGGTTVKLGIQSDGTASKAVKSIGTPATTVLWATQVA